MGKFDGILIMSDYDGTLTVRKGAISEENRRAVEYFESEGGIFCIASGRDREFVLELGRQIPLNGWCITVNGTVICSPDGRENAVELPFPKGDMAEVCRRVIDACPRILNIRHYEGADFRELCPADRFEDFYPSLPEPLYKLVVIVETEDSDEYKERIEALLGEDYIVARSWPNGIEIQPAGTGKGDAIARLRELYGGRIHTVIAVGDYENDIDMIKKADIGYAVANAIDSVKAVADRITVANTEHAIAAIVAELDK
ncbi:MAG: HAD family hydrolase [Clostridia bacterium]|nr:HAD family hydrolase [Clostridia bacterium]